MVDAKWYKDKVMVGVILAIVVVVAVMVYAAVRQSAYYQSLPRHTQRIVIADKSSISKVIYVQTGKTSMTPIFSYDYYISSESGKIFKVDEKAYRSLAKNMRITIEYIEPKNEPNIATRIISNN